MSFTSNGTSTASNGNSEDPTENHGPIVTAVTAWMLAFSTAFVALRCVSRLGIVKRWGWDDSFIVAAWVRDFLCYVGYLHVGC